MYLWQAIDLWCGGDLVGKVHAMLACDVAFLFTLFKGGGDLLFRFGRGVTLHLLPGNIFQQVLHLRYVVRFQNYLQ